MEVELEHFDIKDFLRSNGYPVRDSGGQWIQSVCKYRGGQKFNLSINKLSGKWVDFVTGQKGTINELVKVIGGEYQDVSFEHFTNEPKLDLPKKFDKSILNYLEKDHSYWVNRGISRAVCEDLGGGIADPEKLPKLKNRYILPIIGLKQELAGFTARYIGNSKSKSIPKYKHIGEKSKWIWPRANSIDETKRVILVESPACCMSLMTCGINDSLCLFGVKLSGTIINYLIGLSVNHIVISTNNEPDNESIGNRAAQDIKDQLSNYFDNVEVRLPSLKDFNEMICKMDKQSIIELLK